MSAGEGIVVTQSEDSTDYKVSLSSEVQEQIKSNADSIDTLNTRVDKNTTSINTLNTFVEENKTRITDLKAVVTSNTNALADLSPKVEKNATDISTLNTSVEENKTSITDLKAAVTGNTNAIAELSPKVTQNTTEINGLKTRVGKNEGNISNLQGRVTQSEKDIDGLQGITQYISSSINNTTIASDTTINGQANIVGNTSIGGSLVVGGEVGSGTATINNGSLVLNNGGKDININATSGTITGLTNVNWNWNDIQADRVATEGQIAKIAASAFTFLDDHSGKITLPLASELQFTSGKNIEIHVSNEAGSTPKVSFVLNQHPEFTTVTTGNVTMSTDGIFFGMGEGQVSLTSKGLNSGGNKITHVADGVDDYDAVNVSQWNSYKIADIKGADENTVVTLDTSDTKAGRTYLISVKHPEVPKYKAGNGIVLGDPAEGSNEIPISVVSNDKNENIIVGNGIALSDVIKLGTPDANKVAPVEIDGKNGTIRLKNITWDPSHNYAGSTNAATESQLYTIANEGWKVSADENRTDQTNIPLGSTLTVRGENNIHTRFELTDEGQKKLVIRIDENPEFTSLRTTGDIIAGGTISAQPKFNIPIWDPIVGIDKSKDFLTSVNGLAGDPNYVVTQKQLYDVISNLIKADRYVVNAYANGNTVTLKLNNHEDVVFDIPPHTSDTVVYGGIILEEDKDNNGSEGNWTATEVVDSKHGRTFTNTTLDQRNSGDANSSTYGKDFVIKDTEGNQTTITDIASATKLENVDNTVIKHEGRIGILEEGFYLKTDNTDLDDSDRVLAGKTVSLKPSSENIEITKYTTDDGDQVVTFDVNKNLKLETLTVKASDSGSPDYPSTEIKIDNQGVGIVNGDSTDYYITKGGLNASGKAIENVATEKNFDPTNTNALNVAAFYPTYEKVEQGFTLNSEAGSWKWTNAGQTLNIVGGKTPSETDNLKKKNIETSIKDGSLYVTLVRDPQVDTITIGVDEDKLIRINLFGEGHIEGIQNLTWELNQTPHAMKKDENGNLQVDENGKPTGTSWAATESQLYFLEHALVDQGTSYAGDDFDNTRDTIVNPKLNEVLLLQGGGKDVTVAKENIKVERIVEEEGHQGFNIGLSKDLKLTKDGSVNLDTTQLTKDSLVFEENVGSSTRNIKATYSLQGLKVTDEHENDRHDLEFSVSRINADNQIVQGVASSFRKNDDGTPYLSTEANENYAANLGDVKALRTTLEADDEPDKNKYSNINLALEEDPLVPDHLIYNLSLNNKLRLGEEGKDELNVVIDGSKTPTKIIVDPKDPTKTQTITSSILINNEGSGDIIGLLNTEWNEDIKERVQKEQKGRAATEEQLAAAFDLTKQEITQDLTKTGLKFKGDSGGTIQKELGQTLEIYGGAKPSEDFAVTQNNIFVSNVNGKLHIGLMNQVNLGSKGAVQFNNTILKEDSLSFGTGTNTTVLNEQGLTIGDGPKFTSNGISANGQQINNVAEGKALTDAVNVSQLNKTQVVVQGGDNISVKNEGQTDNGTTYTVSLENNVTLGKDSEAGSLSVTDDKGNSKVDVTTKDDGGHIKLTGNGEDAPSADISVKKQGEDSTRLTYESSDGNKDVATTDDGLVFADGSGNTTDTISLKNNQLTIKGSDNNIKTSASGHEITVSLNKDIDLGGDGSIVVGGVTINNGGINLGDKKITNVQKGTEAHDAVNLEQLNEAIINVNNNIAASKTEVTAGKNVTVNQSSAGDKHTVYEVNAWKTDLSTSDGNFVLTDKGNPDDLHHDYDISLSNQITIGGENKGDGSITVKDDKGNSKVEITSTEESGHIKLSATDTSADISVGKGNDGTTRLSYEDGDKKKYQVATTQDGINFGDGAGNNGTVSLEEGSFNVKGDANDTSNPEANVVTKLEKLDNGDVTVTVSLKEDLHAHSLILKDDAKEDSPQYGALSFIATPDKDSNKDVAGNTVGRLQFNGQHLATLDDGMQYGADNGDQINLKHNNKLSIVGDQTNITTESDGAGKIAVKLNDDIEVKTVKVGDNVNINNYGFTIGATGPTQIEISEKNIYMGGKQIHGVAPGSAPDDAVNVSQLNQVGGQILNKINDVDKRAKAGIAQAIATAGLPQAYLPGKNLMAASAGTFGGQTAFAVGISSISDDGKWIIKGTFSGNSQSKFGGSVGVGYQW